MISTSTVPRKPGSPGSPLDPAAPRSYCGLRPRRRRRDRGPQRARPHNTVFAGDEPVAFIDWDDAAPGTRRFDFSNAVWSFANVGEGDGPVGEQARLIHVMCDAYGWEDPDAIVDEIHADLRRARANHERAGRLKARNIFQEMIDWMDAHASELKKLI